MLYHSLHGDTHRVALFNWVDFYNLPNNLYRARNPIFRPNFRPEIGGALAHGKVNKCIT
jgi:hypothetical protein